MHPSTASRPSTPVTNLPSPSTRHWVRILASPFGAAALTSLLALAGNALIFRTLSEADAGRFALLTAFLQTVLILGGLGQYTLTQRVYSRAEPGAYAWRGDLLRQLLVTLPASALLALLIGVLYLLPPSQTAFVLVAGLASGLVASIAAMLAANRRYAVASTLPRLPNGLLIVPATVFAAAPALAVLPTALVGLLVAILVTLALGWWTLARLRMRGMRHISPRQRATGLVFLASQASTLVPDYLLLAAAAFFAPPEDLALYAALALLFRPTQLLQNVLAQVLTTELARGQRPRLRRMMAIFAAATALLIGGGILLAGPTTHLVYGGRYTPAFVLIAGISIASGLDVLETLPRSYMIGRGSRSVLAGFGVSQALIAAFGLAVGLVLLQQFGINGAAVGAALIFIARNIASFSGFAVVRVQERPRSLAQ
jgi:O-antigen/teichoic acid export membrane protein